MRGGRVLIIIGIVVLIGALAVGVFLWQGSQQPEEGPPVEVTGEGTARVVKIGQTVTHD